MALSHTIEIRVNYSETDGQGRVHHAQYLNYFERGRVELMRSLGYSYRELEASGLMLVVTEMNVRYSGAAVFDDLLTLRTEVKKTRGVRIEHRYLITCEHKDKESAEKASTTESHKIVEGTSVIACVDRAGKVRRLPQYLRTTSL